MARKFKQLSKGQIILRTVLVLLAVAAVICALYILGDKYLVGGKENEERGTIDESTLRLNRITYKGKQYVENTDTTTLLLLGIDKDDDQLSGGYRDGGQADFIMLVVIDGENKQIKRLQIDRDTMTEVNVLSILGKDMGTRTWQIALAHAFGITPEENTANTIKSVKYLMEGINIDMCASLYLEGIAVFNDALGGVTVLIEDDFSEITDEFPIGQRVTLVGKQAELFARSRMNVGMGTNYERMRIRQYAYMESALELMLQKSRADISFVTDFINTMSESGYLLTDFTVSQLASVMSGAIDYTIMPIEYLEGESSLYDEGDKTYNRFDADPDFIRAWVVNTYYIQE